jgi:rhamnulokinase
VSGSAYAAVDLGADTGSAYAAVDLGADSGRVIIGRLRDSRVTLDAVHRFPNAPVRLPDGLHWNMLGLFAEVLVGLATAAARAGALRGVGVDAWGVDYALLDSERRLLGIPYHYRDRRTDGVLARAEAQISRAELYAVAGIQTMPINTLFQLLAEDTGAALASTDRIALVPDLIALWLCGELVNESTIASTTGLLDARTGCWARDAIARLGLPVRPFTVDPVEPGVTLGPIQPIHSAAGVDVHVVAAHDTASAFIAAPVAEPGAAILSSGTWSLLGVERRQPLLTEQASALNLSNERGIDGSTRLLANVTGLWLLQECQRAWRSYSYDELERLAAAAEPRDAPLFDPDHESLVAHGGMPIRIAELCRASDQAAPGSPGEIVLAILVSLACKYRLVIERLERATGEDVSVVHVIGGGARNALLCRLTADVLSRPVVAGPVEATALGNVLVQARATGELGSLADMRAVARASADPVTYEPRASLDDVYARFLEATSSIKRAVART